MTVLENFSIRIYESPLASIRKSGEFADLTNPVHVLMLAVDFVTELEMNGITNFIGNNTGIFAGETVSALRKIGRPIQAEILVQIVYVAKNAGMTHAAIQQDYKDLPEFSISTFSQLHGDKWEDACRRIANLAEQIDVEEIYSAMEAYCDQHQEVIMTAINRKG